MIVLESMPDGYLYSNILLKLYLRSLKFKGRLMFNDRIPYNSTILAQVTRHNVGVVEKALRVFNDLGLIDVMDNGAIYMLDIQNFIGTSSTEADRKREYREKIETEKGQMSRQVSLKCPDKTTPEIDIEIDKDIEIKIDTTTMSNEKVEVEEVPYKEIVELYNKTCISFNPVKQITAKRKGNMNARYRETGSNIKVFKDIFIKMQNSQFLKNGWSTGGKADFDWVMRPTNFTKVLEGKYNSNQKQAKNNQSNPFLELLQEELEKEDN